MPRGVITSRPTDFWDCLFLSSFPLLSFLPQDRFLSSQAQKYPLRFSCIWGGIFNQIPSSLVWRWVKPDFCNPPFLSQMDVLYESWIEVIVNRISTAGCTDRHDHSLPALPGYMRTAIFFEKRFETRSLWTIPLNWYGRFLRAWVFRILFSRASSFGCSKIICASSPQSVFDALLKSPFA